jgi:RNA polymerase sigma-70 factor (sigma-E family)
VDRDHEFGEYYASRAERMRRFAFLVCGDWDRAEDVAQTAFVKLFVAWHRVNSADGPDPYLRQIIVRSVIDENRRPWRRERPMPPADLPDTAVTDPDDGDRAELVRALATVPLRQRATLVLRFFEDLSVAETAELLGCSTGTVKSQTARGLDALRNALTTANISLPAVSVRNEQ